jgi:hypothetical protein
VGDACDLCPSESDPDQKDSDKDGEGDVCDPPRDVIGGAPRCGTGASFVLAIGAAALLRRRRRTA